MTVGNSYILDSGSIEVTLWSKLFVTREDTFLLNGI